MEPAYALLVCIGCFTPMPLSGPIVPDRMEIRSPRPEDYMTTCFRQRPVERYYDWEKFHNKPRLAGLPQ